MNDAVSEYLANPNDGANDKPKPEVTDNPTPLRLGEVDILAGANEGKLNTQHDGETRAKAKPSTSAPVLRVLSLTEILSYQPPVGSLLVGDGLIELGEIALLFGPPGSYKGFAVGDLMACGAKGHGQWLGHPVNAQFASLWLNCENGQRRLRDQFCKMGLPPEAEKFIHVTDIPAVWNLADPRLAGGIRQTIIEKQIQLLIIDTVSNFTTDEFAKEFAAFFAALNSLLHGLEKRPAVLLIHHSRKPKETDKGARGLLNTISGHQTLQRRARSICYLGRVSEEFDEKRVAAVWLKVSNNGEAEGTKTALQLAENGYLLEIIGFDWNQWEGALVGTKREPKVREEHLRVVFENGRRWLAHKQAMQEVCEVAGVHETAAYAALQREGGRFSHLLMKHPTTGLTGLKPAEHESDSEAE